MGSMMDTAEITRKLGALGITYDSPNKPPEVRQYSDPWERERDFCDNFNRGEGTLDPGDDYDCRICRNKKYVAKVIKRPNGEPEHDVFNCVCVQTRRGRRYIRECGVDEPDEYTLEKFIPKSPKQEAAKKAALAFVENPKQFFFLGGQCGFGKTRICTGIFLKLVETGRRGKYVKWRTAISELRSLKISNPEKWESKMNTYKTVSVLYLDDLFKATKAKDGTLPQPTEFEGGVAFDIIDTRLSKKLITIISSERTEDDLLRVDEAIAGRIIGNGQSYSIPEDRADDYRLAKP